MAERVVTRRVKVPEVAFQRQVIDLCRLLGYKVAHFRPAQNARGQWSTPVQADGAGFPDLVIAGRGRVIYAELKAEGEHPTAAQREWLQALRDAGAFAFVWRPSDLDEIQAVLS